MTAIEWVRNQDGSKGETWNAIVGCSIVSPGCTNCYAMKMAHRIEGINAEARAKGTKHASQYDGTTKVVNGNAVWTGKVQLAENALLNPLKRKKPTTYFVNSMSDLFHESVPDEWIDRVFAVMALSPQHTFQVLTKRAKRMRDYFANLEDRGGSIAMVALDMAMWGDPEFEGEAIHAMIDGAPLPNVWLGVSTERQQEADERIPLLLQTPAAVRFISAEPLLGPIDLTCILAQLAPGSSMTFNSLHARDSLNRGSEEYRLDWVIVGGESGPDARPMHPDWARQLRVQCEAASVPFFFKQWGAWAPWIDRDNEDPDWRQPYSEFVEPHFRILNLAGGHGFHGDRVHVMRLCSKKAAGRALDGVEYSEMPQVTR